MGSLEKFKDLCIHLYIFLLVFRMYSPQLRNNEIFNSLYYKFHVVSWFLQIFFIAHCKTVPSEAACG